MIALPSVLVFLFVPANGAPPGTVGAVNLPIFAITIAMTLLTAPLGASLAHKADPRWLKRLFAVFLMLVALNMLRKALFYDARSATLAAFHSASISSSDESSGRRSCSASAASIDWKRRVNLAFAPRRASSGSILR